MILIIAIVLSFAGILHKLILEIKSDYKSIS
jgi:hypothetical protein